MSLAPGEKSGPYEIAGPIGTGGIGEVYRAREPGREGAIKGWPMTRARLIATWQISPAVFGRDATAQARPAARRAPALAALRRR